MSYSAETDLVEQVARLTARVAELEHRLSWLENGGPGQPVVAATGGSFSPDRIEELVAGVRSVLEHLGEAEVGQIRQELIKAGFPLVISRSDINKVLYRHTELFSHTGSEANKPQWKLI